MNLPRCGGCRLQRAPVHLNQKVDYGLYFLSVLKDAKHPRSTREIAEEGGLSFSFMQKIAHLLKCAGLVQSCRGKEGGYRLTRPARTITVRDIVDALESHRQNTPRRKLGTPTNICPQRNFCALRSAAAHIKDEAVDTYLSKRLVDILCSPFATSA